MKTNLKTSQWLLIGIAAVVLGTIALGAIVLFAGNTSTDTFVYFTVQGEDGVRIAYTKGGSNEVNTVEVKNESRYVRIREEEKKGARFVITRMGKSNKAPHITVKTSPETPMFFYFDEKGTIGDGPNYVPANKDVYETATGMDIALDYDILIVADLDFLTP